MIKAIGYRKIDITEEEYLYYSDISKELSADGTDSNEFFTDIFETDKKGNIIIINPKKSVPWIVIFFLQSVMINQRLRDFDNRINKLESGVGKKK